MEREKTCNEYTHELGLRIQQYRINSGLTQLDLQKRSGVSIRCISRLEQGASVQWESLCRVLIALGLGNNIDNLVPDQTKRPSYFLKDAKHKYRVRKSKTINDTRFKWGDES